MARRPSRSRIAVRRKRRKQSTKFRLHAAKWVDPFPWIEGTLPEKMVFAELVKQGFYFIYQGDFPKTDRYVQVSAEDPAFQPDIIVPEWKVIIDPFGDYHHSKADARESDARKLAFYEKRGYEFLHPWSSDIEKYGGAWVLQQSKRLYGPPMFKLDPEDAMWKRSQGYRLGKWVGRGLAGLRAANRKRTRPKAPLLRSSQGR
jgi:hypothetical protein